MSGISTAQQDRRSRSTSALGFIFICLLVSGLLRFGSAEVALAKDVTSKVLGGNAADNGASANCISSEGSGSLLRAIRESQNRLETQESQLENRMQALAIAEMKLKENTAALVEAEKRLAATLAIADEASEKDLLRLTNVYENMKSKKAARLFAEMAPEFAAGFMARMRADSAALIMSSLPPEKAYTISLILAGRNAAAPVD